MLRILNSAFDVLGAVVVHRSRNPFRSLLCNLSGIGISGLILSIQVMRDNSSSLPGRIVAQNGGINGKIVSKHISLLKQLFRIVIQRDFVRCHILLDGLRVTGLRHRYFLLGIPFRNPRLFAGLAEETGVCGNHALRTLLREEKCRINHQILVF